MRTLLTLLLVGTTAFAAPVPKEVKKSPLGLLQGKWVIVTMDSGTGQKVQTDDFEMYNLTIEGEKLSSAYRHGPICQNAPMTFDFEAMPMRMTVAGMTYIFKFENDQLWKCHGQGNAIPTEFKGGDGRYCTVLKRADK